MAPARRAPGALPLAALCLLAAAAAAAAAVAPMDILTAADFVTAFQTRAPARSVSPCLAYTLQPFANDDIVGKYNGSFTVLNLPNYPYDYGNKSFHEFLWFSGPNTIFNALSWNAADTKDTQVYAQKPNLFVNNLLAIQGFPPCVYAGDGAYQAALVWDACAMRLAGRPSFTPTAAFFLARFADPAVHNFNVPADAYRSFLADYFDLKKLTGCSKKFCVFQAAARDGDVKLKPKECGCSDAFVNTLNTLASKYAPGTNGTGTTAKCYAAARDMVNAELAAGAGTAVITAILRAAIDVCDDASVYNAGNGLGWTDTAATPAKKQFPKGFTFPEYVTAQPSLDDLRALGPAKFAAVAVGENTGYPKPCPPKPLA